jgi:hypothetical protein
VDLEQALPAWQLSDGELTAAMLASERALCSNFARMLDLVREVDKRALGKEKGFRNTAALLVRSLRISQREANARVAQATAVMPVVAAALAVGEINREHVHEIEHVLSQTPDTVSPEDLAASEETLVVLARQAIPSTARKASLRLLAYWDVDGKDSKDHDQDLARPHR